MKKGTVFLLFSLFFIQFSTAQVEVTTVTDEFPGSGGVKYGPDGNVYVGNYGDALSNSNGTQIWRWKPDGTLELFATGLQGASGNTFVSTGDFFQSNINGGYISQVSPQGVVSTFVTDGIACPVGIVADPADNLYVCNCCGTGDNMIRKITPAGVSTPFAGGTLFKCPNGITIDPDQNLYVSNFNDGRVLKITPAGSVSVFAEIPGGNNGHLTYSPADSSLYVASHGSSNLYKVNMDQEITLVAGNGIRGNADGPAFQATFSRPNGMALSSTGDTLWVNSSIPVSNVGLPLNPSVLRMVTGLQGLTSAVQDKIMPELSALAIFPNPSTGDIRVNFELQSAMPVEWRLYDPLGRLVEQGKPTDFQAGVHTLLINLESHPAGLYEFGLWTNTSVVSRKLYLDND
ncbi:MAG: hypothetical protein KDC34_19435 [Saprospiraceae bacterium]|nr:hypothetical protein [Saprospiraceae bacterium]